MYDDRELIDKILRGNKAVFSIFVKKYEKLVWSIVSRMVLDKDDIKDICQEVFIKIYINLEKFKFDSKLSTWIATITYRLTLNHLKKIKKVKQFLEIYAAKYNASDYPELDFYILFRHKSKCNS